jgi:2-keto-4-pentenoate hydratase/2-oxohepta-3-ene-1,7-dioic acid hydratase in catechol pathway
VKLLNFVSDGCVRLGVKTERGILDVARAVGERSDSSVPTSMEALLQRGDDGLAGLAAFVESPVLDELDVMVDEESVRFAPVVLAPGKVICVGLNYRRHAIEANMLPFPEKPILFSKFTSALSAHGDEVRIPRDAEQVDYEAELAIVIGKTAKYVDEATALDHVLGYCNSNDLSVREFQFLTSQWLLGKTPDGFCPLGPYLVTRDEAGDPNDLEITLSVNGEERQRSSTSDMIFDCRQIISFASQHMTLHPGDVILTGTPNGVIMGLPEERRVWLSEGDVVTVETTKLGRLTTTMRDEAND